ncbi:polyhydroxyalkanoate synthesis repressor PhaR [Fodinicurvata sp. EGI_FJ10296]|uniref:polyhydroxyalkanoate synthesis repressor PhaR n=1 Tax=Fodinicurvata sp. EGI_FJ10296 TaxID=3231908 RepID=UPI003455EB37
MAINRSGTSSSQTDEAAGSSEGSAPIRIKKYANRRLYNTATSSYVTLEHLAQMVKEGQEFVVHDAKTGEEITRAVLTQIIVEEESKTGQNMLPIGFLRQLIGLYGNNMQWMVPKYLEYSLETFSENQERMRQYMQNSVPGMFPFGAIDDVSRQNVAMFEQAMKMFSPFPTAGQSRSAQPQQDDNDGKTGAAGHTDHSTGNLENEGVGATESQSDTPSDGADSLSDMHRRLDELQRQMEALGRMGKAMSDAGSNPADGDSGSGSDGQSGSGHDGGAGSGKKASSAAKAQSGEPRPAKSNSRTRRT